MAGHDQILLNWDLILVFHSGWSSFTLVSALVGLVQILQFGSDHITGKLLAGMLMGDNIGAEWLFCAVGAEFVWVLRNLDYAMTIPQNYWCSSALGVAISLLYAVGFQFIVV